MDKHLKTLEWDVIAGHLAQEALCAQAQEKCLKLMPHQSREAAERAQRETTGARQVMDYAGTPPLTQMAELRKGLKLIEMDAMLLPEQLMGINGFLATCRRMKNYLGRAEACGADIAFYGRSMVPLHDLEEGIASAISDNRVADRASDKLASLRKKIAATGESVKTKLNTLLTKNPKWFSESFVSIRNGRYTLPVKRECKANLAGRMIDMSASGATCFIEPASVGRLIDELASLEIQEDAEVRRVLYELTELVATRLPEINLNIQAMEQLDFVFAKAKYAIKHKAVEARFNSQGVLSLLGARHPLIDEKACVPLDFQVGGQTRGVVITGPNTGGKTVALKTAGLLSQMAQSGLHVPCDIRSSFVINDQILCDIGDGQSISQNLSTFSSHIVNVIDILKRATSASLVLLDELGSGTDPQEGMGIAQAVLQAMLNTGCLFAATTHYPEIKAYATRTEGLVNARMAFDRERLCPLYRLEIGTAGESCALFIAEKLGFPRALLEQAHQAAYGQENASAAPRKITAPEGAVQTITPLAQESKPEEKPLSRARRFNLGDSVTVYPQKELGIVCSLADKMGMVGIIIKRKKQLINHKRLKLYIAADELYPEDYDFSIVFDTVAARKARHIMQKRHAPELAIEVERMKEP